MCVCVCVWLYVFEKNTLDGSLLEILGAFPRLLRADHAEIGTSFLVFRYSLINIFALDKSSSVNTVPR